MKKNQGKKTEEFRPKRSLGQNFLTDDALFEQLVHLCSVGKEDAVLEIGAGAGGMTKALSKACREVTSIEVDGTLLPILRVTLEKCGNVKLVHGDVMRLNLPELTAPMGPFHIVANIPYYLTTDLMMLFDLSVSGVRNLMSSLSVLKSYSLSRVNDEYPLPKSSIHIS